MLVGTGFDTDGQRQFRAVTRAALLLDRRHMEPGTGEAFLVQQLADLLVVAAVDGDDFELVVSLAEQQRQVVLNEIIAVLADYDDDGNGRRRDLRPDAPVVAEAGEAAVPAEPVVQLDEKCGQGSGHGAQHPVRMRNALG